MDEPASYEIRVAEPIDDRWTGWFDGLAILPSENGETVLRGELADQPALHGILGTIHHLGLTLISVRLTEGGT
jgi:hypothetical protein